MYRVGVWHLSYYKALYRVCSRYCGVVTVESGGVVTFELGTWWKASVSGSVSPVLKTRVAESLSPAPGSPVILPPPVASYSGCQGEKTS